MALRSSDKRDSVALLVASTCTDLGTPGILGNAILAPAPAIFKAASAVVAASGYSCAN